MFIVSGAVRRGQEPEGILDHQLRAMEDLIEDAPRHVDALDLRAGMHRTLALHALVREGEDPAEHVERALADWDRAAAIHPSRGDLRTRPAEFLFEVGERLARRDARRGMEYIADSIERYEGIEGPTGDGNDIRVRLGLAHVLLAGHSLRQGGDGREIIAHYDRGIEHLTRAIRGQPRSSSLHGDLGRAIVGRGRVVERMRGAPPAMSRDTLLSALAYLTKGLTISPEDPGLYRDRAWIEERLGRLRRALRDLEACRRLASGAEAESVDAEIAALRERIASNGRREGGG